jgi:hypothetical protein
MPLTINNSQSATGSAGGNGAGGAQGNSSQRQGGVGGAGQAGGLAQQIYEGQNLTGDAGGDQIILWRAAQGGDGGTGGFGGSGLGSSWTQTTSGTTQTTVSDTPGNGGNSGAGGAGGTAEVVYAGLSFLLDAAQQSRNQLRLSGRANGGRGASSSYAGNGGNSGWNGTLYSASGSWSSTYTQQAAPGGRAGAGNRGGPGGQAFMLFEDLAVVGENLDVELRAEAIG